MTVRFDCYVHVPFIRMDGAVDMGTGELGILSVERWLSLEDPSFGFQENRYLAANPVFYQRSLELEKEGIWVLLPRNWCDRH